MSRCVSLVVAKEQNVANVWLDFLETRVKRIVPKDVVKTDVGVKMVPPAKGVIN